MLDRSNRTFICSVVFLDIAEYSKKPVAEQLRLKERFNAAIGEAIRNIAVNDRIILDTGDGAAISFLGSPEDALFVAMSIRDATTNPPPGEFGPLPVRIGINLGPVRLVKDINGQPNIIGDGINVAQRVMGFAQPSQILVSRSYYEVVSCLAEDFARLFRYEGSRTDKHVRAHDVYAVGYPVAEIKGRREAAQARVDGEATVPDGAPVATTARQGSRMLWIGLPLVVAAILAVAAVIRVHKLRTEASLAEAPQQLAESPRPEPEPTPELQPPRTEPQPPRAEPQPPRVEPQRPKAETPAPAREEPRPRPPKPLAAPERKAPEPGDRPAVLEPAHLVFVILPWGEVYVDGKLQGVSPPLRVLDVRPGKHRIEIHNQAFPPYSEVIEVKSNDKLRIHHRFE